MASEVEICNNALVLLGDARISSLTEDTPQARYCNAIYAESRRAVLSDHPWNCATKRARLARSATAPVYGYAYRYALPADCLRVLAVKNDPNYQVEGRFIVTDEDDVYITYVSDVTDPNEYTPGIRQALSALLAAKIAYAVTQSTTKEQSLMAAYESALSRARSQDSREGTPQSVQPTSWVASFYGNRSALSVDDVEV